MTRRTALARRLLATFALSIAVTGIAGAPLVAEHAVETVSFADHLGAVPVEVSLTRNGTSTVDTGVLGRLYWEHTGAWGFGALLRITGPPDAAGSSLADYVSPQFLRTNTAFIDNPEIVALAYGKELQDRALLSFVRLEGVVAIVGGLLLTLVLRGRPAFPSVPWRRRALLHLAALTTATACSVAAAGWLFHQWDGSTPVQDTYPMPGVPGLSFSSPQALEVAAQVRPFVEKNSLRIRQRSDAYTAAAEASLADALSDGIDTLVPGSNERIILAEADPQGSFVGQRVRTKLYAVLRERLGKDAFVVRTISGDVTSNGTVAEDAYVRAEADTLPGTATVAVKGDHDTATTVEQMEEHEILNPHLDPVEVEGLRLVAGNDPAFKTLFGGTVINDSGITEADLGASVRQVVVDGEDDDERAMVVLLHQPVSAAAYLGIDSVDELDAGSTTTPRDDGIADLPPGIVNIGHLHDPAAPKVVWNTDTDQVTWTVVNQLGTAGGVEENPTFNRFSTPFSTPLKDLTVQLQYVDVATGLQTGFAELTVSPSGEARLSDRIDLGLPLGAADDISSRDGAGSTPAAVSPPMPRA